MRNPIAKALRTVNTLHEKCHDDNAKHRPYNRRDPVEEIEAWYGGEDDIHHVDTHDMDDDRPLVYNVF